MPRTSVSDEEIVLKKRARRRLIGAIVLVTLVIVLLPMFLDSEPRPLNQEISIQIPAQSTEFSSRVASLPKPAAPESANAGEAKEAEAAKANGGEPERKAPDAELTPAEAEKPRATEAEGRAEPEKRVREERAPRVEPSAKSMAKAETKPQPKPETKPQPKPVPKPAADAPREREAGGDGFVVQVAALTDPEKAKSLKGRISESGLRAYTEVVRTARGDVTRVRVGPYPSKEAAQKAAEELKKLGLSGVVAPRG